MLQNVCGRFSPQSTQKSPRNCEIQYSRNLASFGIAAWIRVFCFQDPVLSFIVIPQLIKFLPSMLFDLLTIQIGFSTETIAMM